MESIYNQQTGEQLLKYFFKQYDIKALDNDTLVAIFTDLFDLKNKKLNIIEQAVLSGRIKKIVEKYKVKKL